MLGPVGGKDNHTAVGTKKLSPAREVGRGEWIVEIGEKDLGISARSGIVSRFGKQFAVTARALEIEFERLAPGPRVGSDGSMQVGKRTGLLNEKEDK